MPLLEREADVRLSWTQRGERGPLVVLAPYWSGNPDVFGNLIEDLASDHRVVTYDARGTGDSTRRGPHDAHTLAADLAGVIETAGGPAVIVGVADSANHAVSVASRQPELALAAVSLGTAPLSTSTFEGSEGMVSSATVRNAFLEMLGTDYRGALRTLLAATNPQMEEGELRERVRLQADYCPQEAAVERVASWTEDDPVEAARQTGERLWILTGPDVAGPWLPPQAEAEKAVRELFPNAHYEVLADGAISRPDLTAATIRQITDQD